MPFPNVDLRDNCLHYAARLGKTCLIEIILDTVKIEIDSRNPNDDLNTALCIACDAGWLDTAKVLISRGSKINYENAKHKTPLILASELIYPYDFQMSKLLISNGALVNYQTTNGNTALLSAAKFGNPEVINLLLKANSNINSKFSDGATALMRACYYNYPEIVDLLLVSNADVEARNKRNETALYIAAYRGYLEIVKILVLKYKADVNSEDIDGDTPLAVACYEDKPVVVKFLLENGGLVNKKGIRGDTPLHIAVANCPNEVVKMLLNNGADPNMINNDQETPLHIAIRHNQPEILKTLLKITKNLDQGSIYNCRTAFKCLMETLSIEKIKMACDLVRSGCDVNKSFTSQVYHRGYEVYVDSPFEYIFRMAKSKFRFVQQINLFGEFDMGDEYGLSCTALSLIINLISLIVKAGYRIMRNDLNLYENSWLKEYLDRYGIRFKSVCSLCDLSRLKIRECLKKPLDESIEFLDLPENLKMFLKFF
ncbi:unnamed protein product [Brachionus calyciflorus]|uniref:SOCS box domain-containing protein n=1 Tax=Brachionus calyciflorus TaxID=104777 RepID=A0A813T2W6_9BILA|nr:unnamed protein product [Brachionus calyciflorus]